MGFFWFGLVLQIKKIAITVESWEVKNSQVFFCFFSLEYERNINERLKGGAFPFRN